MGKNVLKKNWWSQSFRLRRTKEGKRSSEKNPMMMRWLSKKMTKSSYTELAEKPDPYNAVSTNFSVPSNDLWFLSVLKKMEMSVVESVSMKGSIVRMIVRKGLSSKSLPPPLLL